MQRANYCAEESLEQFAWDSQKMVLQEDVGSSHLPCHYSHQVKLVDMPLVPPTCWLLELSMNRLLELSIPVACRPCKLGDVTVNS